MSSRGRAWKRRIPLGSGAGDLRGMRGVGRKGLDGVEIG